MTGVTGLATGWLAGAGWLSGAGWLAGTDTPPSRWWNELVAGTADYVPGGTAGLAALLLLFAGGTAFGLLYRRRPRSAPPPELVTPPTATDEDDEVPELPPEQLRSLADRYAAEGRYAEAVRERLRAMVRELVQAGVIEHRPGWTVTELAAAAGTALPVTREPLDTAARLFSDIWYGRQPALADHDERMRDLESGVREHCARVDTHATN
ncbi:MAG: DUF4129 domain-containing protein, partial [Micromonosporaceae bacterium]